MKKTGFLALAALAAVTLGTACSNKNKEAADTAATDTVVIEEVAVAEPADSIAKIFVNPAKASETATDSTYATTASGLKYMVMKEGTGKTPTASDNVTVHYTGRLLDGTVFDSSVDRGEAATFPLGAVIKGWTEGLQLMKEGGVTVFYIPSNLAYGPQGTPGGPIGPNQDLIFEVELIKVN